jgi:hypothetical protein
MRKPRQVCERDSHRKGELLAVNCAGAIAIEHIERFRHLS